MCGTTGMLGEMSRWLGEAGRGPQRLVGALETKEECVCVCDLHGSGLVTWVLSACLSQRKKKRDAGSIYKGKPGLPGKGSV